ncbi:MAG: hypothetical protein ACRDUA_06720 [Micromonosporaceae bacterium]
MGGPVSPSGGFPAPFPVPPSGGFPVARRQPAGLIVVVSLLAVGLLASLCVAGTVLLMPQATVHRGNPLPWPNNQVKPAVREAERCVVSFLTVSADTVDEDTRRVLDCSTGRFEDEYRSGRAEVRRAVVENEVRSTGEALETAVEAADSGSATVLLAVDATIRNTKHPEGRQVHYRISVDMERAAGEWKISRLEFVG